MISVTWTGIISIGKDNTDFDITSPGLIKLGKAKSRNTIIKIC